MIAKKEVDELALDLLPCHQQRYQEIRRLRREVDPSGESCLKFKTNEYGEIVSFKKGYRMPSVPPIFSENEKNSF